MNAIDRKCYRELKYEMNLYDWELVKLPNGKTKAVIVKEQTEYKDWGIDEEYYDKTPEQVIIKRQTVINSFEIMNGFPKRSGITAHFSRNSI
jgi:hypothetical protein